jgi:hypothetical protein
VLENSGRSTWFVEDYRVEEGEGEELEGQVDSFNKSKGRVRQGRMGLWRLEATYVPICF